MTTTQNETIDLGNNESMSRGVFEGPDGYTALAFSRSKTFKTRQGAEKWLARVSPLRVVEDAREAGRLAFSVGTMRAPAMDAAVPALLARTPAGEACAVLAAWLSGWDSAWAAASHI